MRYRGGPEAARKRCAEKKYKKAAIINCACGCGLKIKEVNKHGRAQRYINGHSNRKYDDPKQYKKEYLSRHKEELKAKRLRKRRSRKVELIRYKGGKCEDCGVEYDGKNAAIFQFHHNQGVKHFLLSHAIYDYGMDTLKSEADLCDLLCANCHFMVHSGEYQ